VEEIKMRRLWLTLVLLGLVVVGCGLAPTSTEEGAAGEARVLRVGVIAPYTGPWADGGTRQLHGAQLKQEELEDDPEYSGVDINIIPCDDASENDEGVSCAKKLILEDEVHVILGALNSNVTLAVVPTTKDYGVAQFTLSGAMAICDQDSHYIFRATPNEEELADYALSYFLGEGLDKVAILHETDAFGTAGGEGMLRALQNRGMEPVAFETWDRGDKDFSGQLSRIEQAGVEALSLNGGAPDSGTIVKQLREQYGMDIPVYGSQCSTFNYRDLAGDAQENTIFVSPFTAAAAGDNPHIARFLEGYLEKFGREGDAWAACHYYNLHTVADAVLAAPEWGQDLTEDRDWIADFVHETGQTAPMVKGMTYDETGEPSYNAYIVKISAADGGGFEDVVLGRRDDFVE
jgi:branched-chain amino acid transport system substrate-binding protein